MNDGGFRTGACARHVHSDDDWAASRSTPCAQIVQPAQGRRGAAITAGLRESCRPAVMAGTEKLFCLPRYCGITLDAWFVEMVRLSLWALASAASPVLCAWPKPDVRCSSGRRNTRRRRPPQWQVPCGARRFRNPQPRRWNGRHAPLRTSGSWHWTRRPVSGWPRS